MKKFIILPIILLAILFTAAPALADDPPDMDVDIGVSAPGDVDMDVDIDAGGDVDLTVDGYDLDEVAYQANEAFNRNPDSITGPGLGDLTADWYSRWYKEIGPYHEAITKHSEILALLSEAQARLISEQTLTDEEIADIIKELDILKVLLQDAVETSQETDEEIQHQLIYGAETHIAANQIAINQLRSGALESGLDADSLRNRVSALEKYTMSDIEYGAWLASQVKRLNKQDERFEWYLVLTWIVLALFFITVPIILKKVARRKV